MKKLLMATCCSLVIAGALYGEDSGVFVGVSYQGGQTYLDEHVQIDSKMGGTTLPNSTKEDFNKNKMTNGAGIKIGYKQFFGASKWFGLRYYGFLDYGHTDFGKGILPNENYKADMYSYGVGIDTLWNLVNKGENSFGFFVGVGLGADTWIANGKGFQKEHFPKGKPAYASFQTTIDAGLRTNFAKHHGFEIGVKVPLLQDKIFSDKDDTQNGPVPGLTLIGNNKTNMHRLYSVYLSYIYTF